MPPLTSSSIRIIPTIFATTLPEFRRRLHHLAPNFNELQIDIMDGRFVPAKSIDLSKIPNISRVHARFEAHLMTENPTVMVPLLAKKGFVRVIAHIEALRNRERILAFLKAASQAEMEAGLAINPNTRVQKVIPYLDQIRLVLFLGVYPGKEGQRFIPSVAKKIQRFKAFRTPAGRSVSRRDVWIQIDGGVNPESAACIAQSGAHRFNTGSYAANAKDPKSAVRHLKQLIRKFALG